MFLPISCYAMELTDAGQPIAEAQHDSPPMTSGESVGEEDAGEAWNGEDLFGSTGGYVHPYLSAGETWNDNILNTNNNAKSDTITILSPGIWFALPRSRTKAVNITTSSYSSGGLVREIDSESSFRRFQAYLHAGGDFNYYNSYSDENTNDYTIEGALQLHLKGGISGGLVNQYNRGHNARGTGYSNELDKYKNNLSSLTLSYDISEKIKIQGDLSNFDVNYDATENDYNDRSDDSYSLYLYYRLRPHISIFTQYQFIDVSYDSYTARDSEENHGNLGIQWNFTEKTKGLAKIGYVDKEMKNTSANPNDVSASLTGVYNFTPKTSLGITARRAVQEASDSTGNYTLCNSVNLNYSQKLSNKITFRAALSYINEDYDGSRTIGSTTGERQDDFYSFSPGVRYAFNRWLQGKLAYTYSKRDSNFSDYDYTNNTIMLSVGAGF